MKLSLIVPVYKNEKNIPPLIAAIEGIKEQICDFEAVFVVDGSPDQSLLELRARLPNAGFACQLIALSRNFGAFPAVRAGLAEATGQVFAVMAADLQEPPELVIKMYRAIANGECDVAYGMRRERKDGWLADLFSSLYWRLIRRIVSAEIPPGGVDMFGCVDAVRRHILALNERNSSLIGLLFWVGFRRKAIPYARAKREIGKSAWTFGKKWKYAQDSIFSFSDLPISLLLSFGFLGLLFSSAFGLIVLAGALLGRIEVPGYAATILVVLFFGMLQLLSIGVIGIYIWRIFENTKGRPLHIVMSSERFGEKL